MSEYLGREHFVDHQLREKDNFPISFGQRLWTTMISRRAYPPDERKPDLSEFGIIIVRRDETDLGPLPTRAVYPSGSETTACGRYAIEFASLSQFVTQVQSQELALPDHINARCVNFLDGLVQVNQIPSA